MRTITRYTLLLPLTVFMLAFVVILVSAILEGELFTSIELIFCCNICLIVRTC